MSDLWAFSVAAYGAPGAAVACLRLQDRHGVDVNVLLFSLWAARDGHELDVAAINAVVKATADWQTQVVQPLRGLRQRLKADGHGAPAASAERVRAQIKAAELEAERVEQEILARRGRGQAADCDKAGLARRNIFAYLEVLGCRLDVDDQAAVDLLAQLADEPPTADEPERQDP